MHRFKSRLLAVALATALAAPFASAPSASAAPAPDGCKNSVAGGNVAGAELAHYPAQPASQSSLRVSCSFNNNTGTSIVSPSFSINDFPVANWHNGAARTVNTSGVTAAGSPTIVLASCAGLTGTAPWAAGTRWFNRMVATANGASGIPARTFVESIVVNGAGPTCTATLSNNTGVVAIPNNTPLKLDNHHARTVANSATAARITFAAASNTLTCAHCNFRLSDIGLSVTGTEIPPDTQILNVPVDGSVTATITNNTLTADSGMVAPFTAISIGSSALTNSTRQCNDATSVAPFTTVTSVACRTRASDIGLAVNSPSAQWPDNTRHIVSFAGGPNTFVVTPALPATPLNGQIYIGDPSITAPQDDETISSQGVQLDLDEGLVNGSEPCSEESAEGFITVGKWRNPGEFTGAALFNTQPAATRALGQIIFETSVTTFSGFVIETGINPSISGRNLYAVIFPNAPTTAAMCAGTATSPGLGLSLGIQGQSSSVGALPTGTGRPGTGQLRSVYPDNPDAGCVPSVSPCGYASQITLTALPVNIFLPAAQFTRDCFYPSGARQVAFTCGNG